MVDRVTTARLRADASQFMREMAKAAAAAKAFDKSLSGGAFGGGTSGPSSPLVQAGEDVRKLRTDLDVLGDSATGATYDVDRFSGAIVDLDAHFKGMNDDVDDSGKHLHAFGLNLGNAENRMQTITQAILAIGPAAVPALAAVGAGAVALAGTLTFAAAGATSALLAFSGVGDAVKALNEASTDPSIANLEKLQEAMDELGPAAQNFAVFLQDLGGNFDRLQEAAARGLFPGLQAGIETMLLQMPLVRRVVSSVSQALGDLAEQGGEAVRTREFREFFNYLATDANEILLDMGRATGLFIAGFADMIKAFGPLTQDFASKLSEMAASFADWADGLQSSVGFQSFVAYIERISPQLLETLGSIGDAVVALATATAGISPAFLLILRELAQTLADFLRSPLGPPVLALAAAMGALSTAMRIGKWAGTSFLIGALSRLPALLRAATLGFTTAAGAQAKFNAGMVPLNKGLATMKISATQAASGIALVGLSMTGLDEQMEISGIAMGAAFGGVVGGGLGAAVGAMVGVVYELATANNDLNAAMEATDKLAADSPTSFKARTAAIEQQRKEIEKLADLPWWQDVLHWPTSLVFDFPNADVEAGTKALESDVAALERTKELFNALANIKKPGAVQDFSEDLAVLEQVAATTQPVLDKMGLTVQEAADWFESSPTQFLGAFSAALEKMESMAGRSKEVALAVSDMDNMMISAADSATALGTALDSMVTPFTDLVTARDAFAAGLQDLDEQLAKNNSSLKGQTDGARQNRAAIIALVNQYKEMISAQAANGAGSVAMAHNIEQGRDAILEAGIEAGLAGDQLRNFLKQMGLTPSFIRTVFETQGITQAEDNARNLVDAYNKLPKEVRLNIKTDGFPKSDADLQALKRRYDLTPKELTIIANVRDGVANTKLKGLKAEVDEVDKRVAVPKVGLDTGPFDLKSARVLATKKKMSEPGRESEVQADITGAEAKLAAMEKKLHNWDVSEGEATATVDDQASPTMSTIMDELIAIDSFTATPTITTTQRTITKGAAEGGLILGPGGPTDDTAGLYALSNREFVAKAASVEKYGADAYYALNSLQADRNALRRAVGMAEGGLVGGMAGGGRPGRDQKLTKADVFRKTLNDPTLMLNDITRALKFMRQEARDVVVAERALRNERQESRDLAARVRAEERTKDGASKGLLQRQKEQAKELEQAEKSLSKQRDELSKATDKLKTQEKALLAQAQAISDAITAQGAIFGGSGTSITAAGILAKLRSAVKDAKQFQQDIAILRGRGLDESLIQQLLEQGSTPEGVQAAHNLAEASASMINQINRQQGRLERVGAATGTQGVTGGKGGGDFNVIFNGPVTSTDVDRLAKALGRPIRQAARLMRKP